MLDETGWIAGRLKQAERLRLFLDYDGTLAGFAPTPDHVFPDEEVVALLTRLVAHPDLWVSVISGRRLSHVRTLVPVKGILLAGSYGLELLTPGGQQVNRLEYGQVRPVLEALKPHWEALLAGREGFYLEDKGWTLAIHARFAAGPEAAEVLAQARRLAGQAASQELFRILGGHKFLEIGPRLAHKGETIKYLLERYPWPGALPVYIGDDDKDEEAFAVINQQGGLTILVSAQPRDTQAQGRLESPESVRHWLKTLPDQFGSHHDPAVRGQPGMGENK
jgi:trehalose-phosphatase